VTDQGPDTPEPEIHEIVRRLNAHLGTTVVAALAGSRDSRSPHAWAEDVTPAHDAEQRIRAAYRVWVMIADSESKETARAWFLGKNPILDGTPPVLALRRGQAADVLTAAEALSTDTWSL
jgi:hypothetical protein